MSILKWIASSATVAGVLSASAPASAQVYDKWFGKGAGTSTACLTRTYTTKHLKAHPAQKVETIAIQHRPKRQNGTASWEGDFEVSIGYKLRGNADWFSAAAYCKGGDVGMPCSVESDGGNFTLEPTNGRGPGLTLRTERLAIEGARKFAEVGKGDDRIFELAKAGAGTCDRLFGKGRK